MKKYRMVKDKIVVTSKKIWSVFLIMALALCNNMTRVDAVLAKENNNDIRRNFIIRTGDSKKLDEIRREYSDSQVIAKNQSMLLEDKGITTIKLNEEEVDSIEQDKCDLIIEPDYEIMGSGKKNKKSTINSLQWNYKMIRNDSKKGKSKKKERIKTKIAIIDSGIDDFNDIELAESKNFVPGDEEVLPLFQDTNGHGTSVAGIIAAKDDNEGITGIAPNTDIYSAKVLDENNKATVSRVVDAIYWAIDKKVNIINMSFGTKYNSEILHKAIKDASDQGILLVAAAGNGVECEYPAAYSQVVSVGSIDAAGNVSGDSVKNNVDIYAPGEKICSTGMFDGIICTSGTSMAAPHVTAVAANLWNRDLSVSADFIRGLLEISANQNIKKKSSKSKGENISAGILDSSHAEKIYKVYKDMYNKVIDKYKINHENALSYDDVMEQCNLAYNTADIPKCEDDECVEGRWTSARHEEMIAGTSFSKMEIAVLKTGTIYADKKGSRYYGWIANPEWHGNSNTINYVSSYIYETRIANALGKGKSIWSVANIAGLSTNQMNDIKNDVNALPFKELLATPNARYKRLFVWGMAVHNMADVFAHSTYGLFGNNYILLDHKKDDKSEQNGYADDMSKFEQRYITAKKAVRKSLIQCVAKADGTASDFYPVGGYVDAGVTWKVHRLYIFINTFDGALSEKMKNYSYQ